MIGNIAAGCESTVLARHGVTATLKSAIQLIQPGERTSVGAFGGSSGQKQGSNGAEKVQIVAEDDSVRIEKLKLGPFGTNAYVLICQGTKESVLVDAPGEADRILERLKGTNPKYILITHGHADHVGALSKLRSALKVPVAAHSADAGDLSAPPDILLNDGDVISFGSIQLKVLYTPGHTPGSLSFLTGDCLISGDTIFPGGPGKTWSPADFKKIIESITGKFFELPDNTRIYPGHGDPTILEKEKKAFKVFSSRQHDPNLYGDVLWASS